MFTGPRRITCAAGSPNRRLTPIPAPKKSAQQSRPLVAFVVAVARNGVIGLHGGLPWRQSSDLKTFRRLTMGKPLVMGRRTFASLGKPLDGRDNIVVTRDPVFHPDGAEVFSSLPAAIERASTRANERGVDEIMIIGGADLYAQLLPHADRLYWTEVDANPAGDTLFPDFDRTQWTETAREPIPQGPKDDHAATLVVLDRISKS